MKKRLHFICLFFIMSIGLSAQEVPEVQKTLFTKITATWCPNCGTWGWSYFEHIIEDNSDKAVFIGAHRSGDLESATSVAFQNNFEAPYQPYFYAGNQDMDVSGGNVDTKRQEAKDLIDANYASSPKANVGFLASLDNDFLTIDTKTKFFQEANGDYFLGVYILEHPIINDQAPEISMAVHPYVMREALTASAFGNALNSGTIAMDTEYTESFSLQLNPNWNKDNLIIAGIIWEKVDDTYQFVNVNSTMNLNSTAVPTIAADLLDVTLFPTITSESAQLNLNLSHSALKVNIQLFNQNGQTVKQIFQGNLTEGMSNFTIKTDELNAGVYFMNIQSEDGGVLTKKLIVQ